jgi:hypothetical protein
MLRATGGGGFESVPYRRNQFFTTISRSRKVDNRSSIRSRGESGVEERLRWAVEERLRERRREISNGVANVRFARIRAGGRGMSKQLTTGTSLPPFDD